MMPPGRVSTLNVHGMGNHFKVGWIDAGAVAAEMVEFKALRDFADELKPSQLTGILN